MASLTSKCSASRPSCAGSGRRAAAPQRLAAVSCRASSADQNGGTRRDLLLAGAAAAAATLLPAAPAAAALREMSIGSLSTFQRGAQRAAYQAAAEGALRGTFTAGDAPGLLALVLRDAATYDVDTKTGGFDGSILLSSEELGRPENARLKPLADRLRAAKKDVDAAVDPASGPISYADLLVLAAKVATQAAWNQAKRKRTQTTSGGDIITTVYGTEWPVRLGRVDSAEPGQRRPPAEDAPVAEVVAYMKQLGVKAGEAAGGPFAPKPVFWERPTFFVWPAATSDPAAAEARFAADNPEAFAGPKTDADRSRATLTRTDYEVEFINTFAKLTDRLGTKFNPDAYLHPETTLQLKF